MDNNQIGDVLREHGEILKEHTKAIAANDNQMKTLLHHMDAILKRLNTGDEQFKTMQDISVNVALLSQSFNHSAETTNMRMQRYEERQMIFEERIETRQAEHGRRIGELEIAPHKKISDFRDKIVTQVMMVLVSSAVTGFIVYLSMR